MRVHITHKTFLKQLVSYGCFQIVFANNTGKYDLEVTTFQMTVLFAWNERPNDDVSFESLRLSTELPDSELRKTLWVRKCDIKQYMDCFFCFNSGFILCKIIYSFIFQSLVSFPKTKRQVLLCEPPAKSAKDFNDASLIRVNQDFGLM